MTDAEQEMVRESFEHALKVGAPGLSEMGRYACISNAMTRIRFFLRRAAELEGVQRR